MPVRLDKIPAPAPRPAPPRAWLWLGLLPLSLLLGVGLTQGLGDEALTQQPGRFWWLALGIPFLAWCGLGVMRALVFILQEGAADGWDEARNEDLLRKTRRGRRSQQVLGVSLYTAVREEATPEGQARQLEALRGETRALQAQQPWQGESEVRHSRLPAGEAERPQELLQQALAQVFADLAQVLAPLPVQQPLALLLEADSGLAGELVAQACQQAWVESGIRQTGALVQGSGLAAVDQWLDQRIRDQALLLVVAFQVAPAVVEDSAEAVVGLLFGNRLTQTTLKPVAYLYRPELERQASTDDLAYATRQSLSWAQLKAEAIEQVWLAGVDSERQADVSTVLERLAIPAKPKQGQYNLDAALGHAGKAAPWLAIAAAAQAVQANGQPQVIFSGEGSAEAGLWCAALKPVAADR
ncbi:hypothetical protein NG726_27985 [Pseudomonas sp. MOB-449]|nr:hypothetical protein [Pseudomonas sp. MOB-449]